MKKITKKSSIKTKLKSSTKTISKPPFKLVDKSGDVYVTQNMLYGVRDELKKTINSKIHGVKSEIHSLKSEIHGLKSEIHGIKSEVHGLKSKIDELAASVLQLGVNMAEQNVRNNYALDAIKIMMDRQDKVDLEFLEHKRFVTDALRALSR